MNRRSFLNTLGTISGSFVGMKLNALNKFTASFEVTKKMPTLFLGHGSPMNAIAENEFVQNFRKVASEIKNPKAILCISAHWETAGTRITAMPHPPTIHDFGGFPKELYQIQYPASGYPALAQEIKTGVQKTDINLDQKWGLDHGSWSVLRHLYPKADVPVIQLSLDYHKSPKEHYELAQELKKLRQKGILIIGSGNMIHNLGLVAWDKLNTNYAYDWAQETNEKMNHYILNGQHNKLIDYAHQGKNFQLAIPTPEHFLPLLYTLAIQDEGENLNLFNNEAVGGSLSMTSVKIG